ncbi:trithorax group protein osa-like [Anopheles darlingi]|uniref:trithorax group protein osa-like n=1 Tax=Anopheles darlingi TaxID=43151 RepID=UPI0021006441|nr:trithorax group protein osa-like [Anopheles darlingi]
MLALMHPEYELEPLLHYLEDVGENTDRVTDATRRLRAGERPNPKKGHRNGPPPHQQWPQHQDWPPQNQWQNGYQRYPANTQWAHSEPRYPEQQGWPYPAPEAYPPGPGYPLPRLPGQPAWPSTSASPHQQASTGPSSPWPENNVTGHKETAGYNNNQRGQEQKKTEHLEKAVHSGGPAKRPHHTDKATTPHG